MPYGVWGSFVGVSARRTRLGPSCLMGVCWALVTGLL